MNIWPVRLDAYMLDMSQGVVTPIIMPLVTAWPWSNKAKGQEVLETSVNRSRGAFQLDQSVARFNDHCVICNGPQ